MKKVLIFLGGGIKLLHGENEYLKGYRKEVIDPVLSQLNSQEFAKHLFITKDYSDLTRNVVKGKSQEVYNKFIIHDAHIALFIIDGNIGNITKSEINLAISATRKSRHPIVFIYGININEKDEIFEYLNQEGIYFQHFYDNRDLSEKIKSDLTNSQKKIEKSKYLHFWITFALIFVLCLGFLFYQKFIQQDDNTNIINNCNAQLYLMRYRDINILTGEDFFKKNILDNFRYEDSIRTGNDISVFPIIGSDSIIPITPPFFRVKIHNSHKNTIVFISAELEIDKYSSNNNSLLNKNLEPVIYKNDSVPYVNLSDKITQYTLNRFRYNVAYGETDDRYFFYIISQNDCIFRMRVKLKSQLGDVLYSNYLYVKYYSAPHK